MSTPPWSRPWSPAWAQGATTHVGLVRAVNEDSLLVAPPVVVVADGMGGHAGGDVASRIVVEEFETLREGDFTARTGRDAIVECLVRAHSRLRDHVERHAQEARIGHAGTTVVAALLVPGPQGATWLVANIGDSRAYVATADALTQVTRDHSVVQQLVDAGQITAAEASVHPERHVITRALSAVDLPEPDFFELPVARAPRLLLCSDGVSGLLDDDSMAALAGGSGAPQEVADSLVAAALAAGGTDNVSVVVVDVMG
ncbi:PP2C family protein-serine/threonine phosphatase [Nocardioides gilvus]|uniref:PP2C family protein-serine/threonine phosphatase n=1 Tax=Nocardioides gilvus TaxID=1735589 RepID=UPI000D745BC5|nr:protein phosphatase 2C domain-containing protein [Nocardioides gilvus]